MKQAFNSEGNISIKTISELPLGSHFCAIVEDSVMVPGFDRHDPSERLQLVNYIAFANEGAMKNWLEARGPHDCRVYRILKVEPVTVVRTVTYRIGD